MVKVKDTEVSYQLIADRKLWEKFVAKIPRHLNINEKLNEMIKKEVEK